MNEIVLLSLVVAAAATTADAYKLTRCDNSTTTTLVKFALSSCLHVGDRFCEFDIGKTVHINLEFQTSTPIASAKAAMLMNDGWQWANLSSNEACQSLGLTCPTVTGTTLKISDKLLITRTMHSALYRYILNDDQGKQVMCLEFPVGVFQPDTLKQ